MLFGPGGEAVAAKATPMAAAKRRAPAKWVGNVVFSVVLLRTVAKDAACFHGQDAEELPQRVASY